VVELGEQTSQRKGESSWGYTYIYPTKAISEKVVNWIDLARNYSKNLSPDDAELEEIGENTKS